MQHCSDYYIIMIHVYFCRKSSKRKNPKQQRKIRQKMVISLNLKEREEEGEEGEEEGEEGEEEGEGEGEERSK